MQVIIIFILGLGFGSFVNALVWRVYHQSRLKRPSDKLSILTGRSMCMNCHHPLHAKDLLPVVSWLYLRGKCRYCRRKIADNPLIELLTGLTFVISMYLWPHQLAELNLVVFSIWLIVLTQLVALAVYDFKWMLLPDRLVLPLFISTVLLVVADLLINEHNIDYLLLPLSGAVLLSGLFYVLFQVSGGRWIGGGDVKLALALGLLAGGPWQALLVLFIASILGSLIGGPTLLIKRKKGVKIPFGPLLIIATFIVYFFGRSIIDWYIDSLV
jgi:leader peptidase (prepilin peptidase) / N-methyltransferase